MTMRRTLSDIRTGREKDRENVNRLFDSTDPDGMGLKGQS